VDAAKERCTLLLLTAERALPPILSRASRFDEGFGYVLLDSESRRGTTMSFVYFR